MTVNHVLRLSWFESIHSHICECSSVAERHFAKVEAVGAEPTIRFCLDSVMDSTKRFERFRASSTLARGICCLENDVH